MSKHDKIEEPLSSYQQPATFEQVWQMFKETDKQFKETDKKFQETDKKIKELAYLFTSQWGRLIESLVEGDLVNLLNSRGIAVNRTSERIKGCRNGENFEFDIIAHNGTEIVIVEVKTTLRPNDVTDFIERLNKAKTYLPEYAAHRIAGCMAFLKDDGHAKNMAMKRGLLVIRATGNSASIINAPEFDVKYY